MNDGTPSRGKAPVGSEAPASGDGTQSMTTRTAAGTTARGSTTDGIHSSPRTAPLTAGSVTAGTGSRTTAGAASEKGATAPTTTTGPRPLNWVGPEREVSKRRKRWHGRARVAEAMVLLTAAGAAQKWVPMTMWSGVLGQHGEVPASWRGRAVGSLPRRAESVVEVWVARAIRRGAQRLPWHSTCLAEATAGQVMLRRRGEPGVVVIGLRPNEERPDGRWIAHAWLLGAQGALTGGPAAAGFTATTVFEVPGHLAAPDVDLQPAVPERC